MDNRFLIIGQGLAGTALAWQLHWRGIAFLIVDRNEGVTSSKIAAGLVTPITGMRLNLNWRYDTLHPEALGFYRKIETFLEHSLYHEVPIVRLLRDEKAVSLWQKRRQQPEIQPYLDGIGEVDSSIYRNPYGGFQQRQSGWLDTAAFLQTSRDYFQRIGSWQKGEVSPEDLILQGSAVTWQGEIFRKAVFCNGWEAASHPWFNWVPFQSAKGTVLSLEADTKGESRVINRGCWLLPTNNGELRAGPTYELNFEDPCTPSPEALAGLETKLRTLLNIEYKILGQQTAVRPIIKGHQVLMGLHPARPQIAFLNGLGSKGVLRAPWASRHLVEHLLEGTKIEPELDLSANL